jgi:23S rRNA (cytosine1962-C5)-methyltransferase
VYRLINGEGDRLGGLVVDVLGSTIVAQSSAYWVERHKTAIEAALLATVKSDKLVWRRAEGRLKQDGYTGDLADIVINSGAEVESNSGAEPEDLIVVENGVKYVVCPEDGQKTGFYCDQRDNRMMIREMSEGKTVLDTFCYSGGFSVNAAVGKNREIAFLCLQQRVSAVTVIYSIISLFVRFNIDMHYRWSYFCDFC